MGMTNRTHGVANKGLINHQKRYKPGILTLLEIRKFQRSTYLLIKKIPFYRLVKNITSKYSKKKFRWNSNSLYVLQEATENYLTSVLSDCNLCANHGNRITVMPRDLLLAKRIKGVLSN